MKIPLEEAYARATPGPFKPAGDTYEECQGLHCCRVFSISDVEVAPANGYGEDAGQAKVNAALLAHAYNVLPEVVKALRNFVDCDVNDDGEEGEWRDGLFYPGVPDYIQQARDALAKVESVAVPRDDFGPACEPCGACSGRGWLLVDNDEHGLRIEKCDVCEKFKTDEQAVTHVADQAVQLDDR